MPTYEYRCANCKHEFEEIQSMSAKPLKRCPGCRKHKLERLMSGGYGFVSLGVKDMKKVGDLANMRRDQMTKTEKEKADFEYANSSTLAAKKLHEDRHGKSGFLGANDKTMKKLEKASKKELQNYVLKGTI